MEQRSEDQASDAPLRWLDEGPLEPLDTAQRDHLTWLEVSDLWSERTESEDGAEGEDADDSGDLDDAALMSGTRWL